MPGLRSRFSSLQAHAIRLVWRVLAGCSMSTLWRMARLAGPLVHRFSRREREVTEINLAQVHPQQGELERQRLARKSLTHSTATMLELGFAWMADLDRVQAAILEVHGRELLDEARADGRGVIVLAPHFGNWELLNVWLTRHFPMTVMYEPPKLVDLGPLILHGRERTGATLVPTNPRGVAALLKALRQREVVGILPDQEPNWGSGVFAPFFGRPAYTGTLLPKLVARTQARVVTGVARRLPGRGFAIHFLEADERVYASDDTTSATGVNVCVEAAISLDPSQYQWEYKRYRKVVQEQEGHPKHRSFRLY